MNIENGALEIFAALIMAMPLAGAIGEKQKLPFQKYLHAAIVCHMAVLAIDSVQWFLLDRATTFNNWHLAILIILPMIIALLGNACFIISLLEYISDRIRVLKKITILLLILFSMSIVSWSFFIILGGDDYVSTLRSGESIVHFSWLYWMSQLSWTIMCVVGIIIILAFRKKLKQLELLSFLSYCTFPVIALVSELFWNGPQVYLSTTLSLILVHSVLYNEQKQRLREHEAKLAQSQIAVMINQIQPHFMFNTLSSICGLCDESPSEAKRVTAKFAEYLRHNVESINQNTPVEFKTELRHVEAYLCIEEKRYESRLNVIYDICTQEFALPSLTVQPLVENAVKHGISKKEKAGNLRLATREHDEYYSIEISDDGVGFDVNDKSIDTHRHIGIENVKTRLWAMCRGTLSIKSEIGVGTTVVIIIPKQKEQ